MSRISRFFTMPAHLDRIETRLERVEAKLDQLNRKVSHMSEQEQQLDAALQELAAKVENLVLAVNDLIAHIPETTAIDLTDEIAAVQAATGTLETVTEDAANASNPEPGA